MKQYKELVNNLKKHNLIKENLDEIQRAHIYKFLMNFSNRIDFLESFISENTDYEGFKVGFDVKFGSKKENWLKDDRKQSKNTGSN